MRIAIAQICSSADPWENLLLVQSLVEDAMKQGAKLVCFPENVFYRGPRKKAAFDLQEIQLHLGDEGAIHPHSAFSEAVKEWAENLTVAVSLGSVIEKNEGDPRPFNSHWVIYPGGGVIHYRKIHLFRLLSSHLVYDEALDVCSGDRPVSLDYGDLRFGLSICYDLRFPELYRVYSVDEKAQVLLIPASFTKPTGVVHWHTLLRARAIENLSYVVAAGQWGSHSDDRGQRIETYGHSLAYDPWGGLLAEAPHEGDALLIVDLDSAVLEARRKQLPALESVVLKG